jgi:hypothetical protein
MDKDKKKGGNNSTNPADPFLEGLAEGAIGGVIGAATTEWLTSEQPDLASSELEVLPPETDEPDAEEVPMNQEADLAVVDDQPEQDFIDEPMAEEEIFDPEDDDPSELAYEDEWEDEWDDEENPDIDLMASNDIDPDIPIDNDMDMSDFA